MLDGQKTPHDDAHERSGRLLPLSFFNPFSTRFLSLALSSRALDKVLSTSHPVRRGQVAEHNESIHFLHRRAAALFINKKSKKEK